MPYGTINYTKGLVIVHGMSELQLAKYIYTNLHLPIKIHAKNKGRESIQITALSDLLSSGSFKTARALANEYSIEYERKTKRLKNFKLFIIMDTDDCSVEMRERYISGAMFDGHPLKEYIIPIYNISNLEDVMMKAGIMGKRIKDSQKGTYYQKYFPINAEPLSVETINQVRTFAGKLSGIKETNLLEFVEYCLALLPD